MHACQTFCLRELPCCYSCGDDEPVKLHGRTMGECHLPAHQVKVVGGYAVPFLYSQVAKMVPSA